ncbi:MAG: hypothetical protein UGF89_05090 [Acutalibacteraceae bacterium]|nr:hypothetical protein [Acutalibacteraceae bacterium]
MADFDLNAILNSLTPDDIENLKQTAASVLGGMGGGEPPMQESQPKQKQEQTKFNLDDLLKNMGGLGSLGMPDLSQLSAIVPILQAFNSQDERLDFINALKPLLSEERQKKADEATKLVKLMSVLPLLRERGIM